MGHFGLQAYRPSFKAVWRVENNVHLKTKHFLVIVFFLIVQFYLTNMASPLKRENPYGSIAFSSRDIDITKEKLFVTLDADFNTASYVIEY